MRRTLVVTVLVLGLLSSPAAAAVRGGPDDSRMSRHGKALLEAGKRPKQYGYGLNRLLDKVAPSPAPVYADADYLKRAIADADQWWTKQGSKPPPLNISIAPSPGAAATGGVGFGYMTYDPTSLGNLLRGVAPQQGGVSLKGGLSLKQRRAALATLWGTAAHERGHNIGYQHTASGLMSLNYGGNPGRAYEWAAEMLPRPVKYRVIPKPRR